MKSLQVLSALILICMLSCTKNDGTGGKVSVTIAASGLSDGKLALNAAATFTANVDGYGGDSSSLSYRWSLATGRGQLFDGINFLASPSVGGNSVRCIGKTGGEESVIIEVLDAGNHLLATESLAFMIVPPDDPGISRGCFDQPKIIFKIGSGFFICNYDGTGLQSLGVHGGTTAAVSPDGEWIAWNKSSTDGWDMWLQRCDGSEKFMIPGGTSEDFGPLFSPDSKTLYFLRPEPSQEKPFNAQRPPDIVAYDIESKQLRFLTTLYKLEESVGYFTVSPVTGEIAFFRQSYEDLPDGGYRVTTKLSFVKPDGGPVRDFTTLPQGIYDAGMDWSPDGKDIILSSINSREKRIYRISLTDGSKPILLYRGHTDPAYPHYYAGGSRIVFGGQEDGSNNLNLWSVDFNGKDLQQITDMSGPEFMQGVLH